MPHNKGEVVKKSRRSSLIILLIFCFFSFESVYATTGIESDVGITLTGRDPNLIEAKPTPIVVPPHSSKLPQTGEVIDEGLFFFGGIMIIIARGLYHLNYRSELKKGNHN
ncbi:hypothetical protein AB6887_11115 [Carnobacterium divergens]|uniref:Gram-positive cocci surface proteins LPxTG domain-containing protein n=1 Tax=Carnobacterium divergens TaxID=2748 RepID=A0A7Z8D2I2_CARDV|nr:hypothetical protein [Carnobacterium divergens]MPQ22970.1 hypothetical protein [Carnobacterium divergens]TFI74463.1 hypothetical protein CKN58_04355 [Carnobacterium divergens]TFI78785.1 hypothetical protein CKN85_04350 [Carnobacterium divergens]TFI85344.1 hypothetical protein CKN56_04325 [Carnobacterium divergens]TFI97700.1 hypothetical protein CKN64_04325 [Carnobacterium divergens]